MRRAITYLRLTAYACGIGGLVLTLWGQSAGAGIEWVIVASRCLLGAMFMLFIVVYVLQALARPARRRWAPVRPPADDGPARPPEA